MRKTKSRPSATCVCATVAVFHIQVMLLVGDLEECLRLVERNRAPEYRGPKISDGIRTAKAQADTDAETRGGYNAFTAHVTPGVVIYAPKPVTLATLVHEISHAVDFILNITGCAADDGELRAYLCQHLFTELAVKDRRVVA